MTDMYAKVRKDRKRNRDILPIVVAVVVVLSAIGIGIIVHLTGFHRRYDRFILALTESTYYADEHKSLRAETDGIALRVSDDNMYALLTYITVYESGAEKNVPTYEEDVFMDYGNGSVLRLWDVQPDEDTKVHGLVISFTDPDGWNYTYQSTKMSLATIQNRYLSTYDNEIWE